MSTYKDTAYDMVLLEKPIGEGLSRQEIAKMMVILNGDDDIVPIEIVNPNGWSSSAMGFTTADLEAGIMSYKNEFEEYIGNILADVSLENDSHVYNFYGMSIWLSTDI